MRGHPVEEHADAVAQLRDVLSLPFRGRAATRAARIELAIRAWARRDAMARQAVDEADASRIGYIAQVFSSLGFSIAEARARAFLLYAYEVAESVLRQQGSPAQKAERRTLMKPTKTKNSQKKGMKSEVVARSIE